MRMRIRVLIVLTSALTICTTQAEAGWTCTARGLVDYSFDGGGCATIHLSGYSYGDCYPVSIKGNTAIGKTGNGTPFTCRKK